MVPSYGDDEGAEGGDADEDAARKQVDALCERMLANPVIEDTEVTIG